jgi:hypothetical protein
MAGKQQKVNEKHPLRANPGAMWLISRKAG